MLAKDEHKVRFQMVEVMPTDPREFCRLFCSNCKASFSYRNLETEGDKDGNNQCPKCGEVSHPHFQMSFLVKDWKNVFSQNVFKIHYLSFLNHKEAPPVDDRPGFRPYVDPNDPTDITKFFSGIPPKNFYKDPDSLNQLTKLIEFL